MTRFKKKKKFRQKRSIASLVLLLSLSLIVIGFVLTFYNNTDLIENVMQTSTSEMVLNEIFNENDQWVAGETKQKEVSFENTGEIEQLLRFKITETWLEQNANGEWISWTGAEDDAVTINYTDYLNSEWTEIGGYYYYNTTISPNEKTNIVMESVSFSSSLDNGGYGSSVDYSGKKCSITIEMEAIEVNTEVALESWNVTCSVNENNAVTWTDEVNDP
ncbi:MAG: BsaA family SipW-dependent biofilm matrix protein [Clostridia bacterium]